MRKKKRYEPKDALLEVFARVKPTNENDTTEEEKQRTKAEYNKMKMYQTRFERGELGQRAIQNLLEKHGYTCHKEIYYTKDS